jgi:hypothetical protein
MVCIQLELFDKPLDIENREMVDKMHKELTNTRKGMFARHQELTKMYVELRYEFETMKQAICLNRPISR